MLSSLMSLALIILSQMLFPFSGQPFQTTSPTCNITTGLHPCMASPVLEGFFSQYQYLGVAASTQRISNCDSIEPSNSFTTNFQFHLSQHHLNVTLFLCLSSTQNFTQNNKGIFNWNMSGALREGFLRPYQQ